MSKTVVPDCCLACKHFEPTEFDYDGDVWAQPYCRIGLFLPVRKQSCKRQQSECKHPNNTFWIDGGLWCPDCNSMAGVTCPLCGGQGFMEENEMEADWINYGDELVTCRECGGKGWTSDPSFQ